VIELGRNWPSAYARIGLLNALLGRPEETFRFVEKAIRLSPCDSSLGEWYLHIGVARFMMDQIEEAIIWLRRATEANPEIVLTFLTLASACSLVGRREEARAALSQYLSLHPRLTVSRVRRHGTPDRERRRVKMYKWTRKHRLQRYWSSLLRGHVARGCPSTHARALSMILSSIRSN
jgi:tetratricopeptide (TPR) repeat protein